MERDQFIVDGPSNASLTLVLAHGAGAPMDSPFMTTFADGLAGKDLRVVRFDFIYMGRRRTEETRTAPDREPILLDRWRDVIASIGGGQHLVIGGKSLGGRIASMIADESHVRGLVCLGYPFHAPGRAPGARLKHLKSLCTPTLIVQGTRDSFGTPAEVGRYGLSSKIRFAWIEDGDHSFKPRASSGRTEQQNLAEAIHAVRGFISELAD